MVHFDDGSDEPSGEDTPIEERGDHPPRYLFTIDGEHSSNVLKIVCDLVADADADLFIGLPVMESEQTPLEGPDPRSEGTRHAAEYVLKAKEQCHGDHHITHIVESSNDRDAILREMIDAHSISTLVTEDQPGRNHQLLLGLVEGDEIREYGDCDQIVVTRGERLGTVNSVLVPIARGPHSGLAIDTGLAIARQNSVALELLHVCESDDADTLTKGKEVLAHGIQRTGEYERVERTLQTSDDVSETIVEYTQSFDITVLGAPREGRLRQFFLGTIPEEVNARTDRTTLITYRGGVDKTWLDHLVGSK